MGAFTYRPEEYSRNLDIVEAYVQDCALYASRMTGKPLAECVNFIRTNIGKNGLAPLRNPKVKFLQRKKNGDRAPSETGLIEYVRTVSDNSLIMAPTMTVYANPDQRESYNAKYIAVNLKKRKAFKKAMFDAKMAGRKELEDYYNILQNSSKIKNNSMSGAHASPSTVLYNKSSHSTLTSTCRISTSYANANNEWFLAGNRHFWSPSVVQTSLIIACRHMPTEAFEQAMSLYGLYYPTTKDVLDVIRYSASLYWDSEEVYVELGTFIDRMTPLERAYFVYNCDLYHLAKYNPGFVNQMLGDLSIVASEPSPDPDASLARIDGDQLTLVVLLCSRYMQGRPLVGEGSVKETDPEAYAIIAATADILVENIEKYNYFIQGAWRPKVLPPSIAVLPNIIRRVVVTSDTDSTIFSNQHWTMWFTGGQLFSEKAYQIGYVTTYLTSQLVKHKLALMSANLGLVTRHIHRISMKNEYYFPVYGLTPVAKHYYAFRSAQEGNVLKEMETEIKGVHLRDSSAPAHVTKQLKKYIENVMHALINKGELSLHDILGPVARLEHEIMKSVREGSYLYTKSAQVKDLSSYVQGAGAPAYQQYLFWNEVFGPKYGIIPPPPYAAARISVDLDRPSSLRKWIETMEDRELADRLEAWIKNNSKTGITSFILPMPILQVTGVPKEITDAIDLRKLVKSMVSPFYLVLESLGLYMLNDDITRLVSDTYCEQAPSLA